MLSGSNFYQFQNNIDQAAVKAIRQNILTNLQILSKIKYQLRNNQFSTLVGDHQRNLVIIDELIEPNVSLEVVDQRTTESQKQSWEKQFDCNVINQPVYLLPPTSKFTKNNSTPWSS